MKYKQYILYEYLYRYICVSIERNTNIMSLDQFITVPSNFVYQNMSINVPPSFLTYYNT